jgi:hypothetical protein
MNRIRPTHKDLAWQFVAIACVIGYVFLATMANLDLTAGRFALFMDERITFDGVQRILHPGNLAAFFWNVMDGGDHRYGRSLWNSMAIASFLPANFFGDTGQIIASRMLQPLLLITAFLVMVFTFVRGWPLRSVLLVALLAMPYTEYYMTMPKPEPLQLFFLAMFLYFYKKNDWAPGKYWIFLGLAFGTKISTLPAMAVFAAASFFAYKFRGLEEIEPNGITSGCIYFFLGLGLAVPILFAPVVGGMLTFLLFRWGSLYLGLGKKTRGIATVAAIVVLLFAARVKVATWISATFLNTKHGADQESINILSWIEYFYNSWLVVPSWVGLAFTVSGAAFLLHRLVRIIDAKKAIPVGFVLILAGLALNLSIFVSAHRLWGFYLYPGSVLVLVGLFSLISSNSAQAKGENAPPLLGLESLLPRVTAMTVAVMAIFYWTPDSIAGFKQLSIRTEQPEYKAEFESYRHVVDTLNNLSLSQNRTLSVAFDPILFPPASNSDYQITEFWGPYVNWDTDVDVIVFSSVHTPQGAPCLAGSYNYQFCLVERRMYSRYVIDKHEVCAKAKCYKRYGRLPNGGEILLLESTARVAGNSPY